MKWFLSLLLGSLIFFITCKADRNNGVNWGEIDILTFFNPSKGGFVSDYGEMKRLLRKLGFQYCGVKVGEWTNVCQMAGIDCVKIHTYKRGDTIIRLYIEDIINPKGSWEATDILFKNETKGENFIKSAVKLGFKPGEPFEGSVYYSRKNGCFEYGGFGEGDEVWDWIQIGAVWDYEERDDKIFRLTPEVKSRLLKYDEVDLFSDGLARVRKDDKWGYVDLQGNEVIPCRYNMTTGRFSEGLAFVETEMDWDYNAAKVIFIDKKGRTVLSGSYFNLPAGNSLDSSLENLPMFMDGECFVYMDAKKAFPNDNLFDKYELEGVFIDRKGHIINEESDLTDTEDNYNEEENDYFKYFADFTPINNAYKHKELTGNQFYIGRDTIAGGNGSSLVCLYLIDLGQPNLSMMVYDLRGIMDYTGKSTLSHEEVINFERKANAYISRRKIGNMSNENTERKKQGVWAAAYKGAHLKEALLADNTRLDKDQIKNLHENDISERDIINAGSSTKLRITNYNHYLSPLPAQGSNTYYVKNMFDDNASTAWAISLDNFYCECDHRWGPEFDVNAKKIDYIKIQNGYCKSETSYRDNARAKWITVFRVEDGDDGCYPEEYNIIYSGPLRDTMEFQTLRVSPEFDNSRPTKRVGIMFGCDNSDYYLGRKYRDLNISEIQVFGTPLR